MISHGLGIDVLAFEYSGYGLSEKLPRTHYPSHSRDGHVVTPSLLDEDRQRAGPSEKACCSDITAVYLYLTQQCNVHPTKIIIFGRSIGSGPAVYCASTRTVAGLVLISPIASAVRVPLKKLNVTLPFIDTFPNIDRVSKITCPVLVVHGDMDELVPKLHAEKLLEKIKQNGLAVSPLWIPTAQHNNVVEDFHSIVFGRYISFLDELKAIRGDRKSLDDDPAICAGRRNQIDCERSRPPAPTRSQRSQIPCLRPPRPPRRSPSNFPNSRLSPHDHTPDLRSSFSDSDILSHVICFRRQSDRSPRESRGRPPSRSRALFPVVSMCLKSASSDCESQSTTGTANTSPDQPVEKNRESNQSRRSLFSSIA